ncbi:MAG: binary toxin-like calcium binding domain-containing protein [Rhodothermales bacterium]
MMLFPSESLAQVSTASSNMACPAGVEPARDLDGDCVDDDLERLGYDRDLNACTPGPGVNGCFVTDPTAWSSDGDPYSDFQEATGVNMDNTIEPPFNNPLVAAMPKIEVRMLRYRFTPKGTITDSQGREVTTSSTLEFSLETTVSTSVTVGTEASASLTDFGVSQSVETETSFSVTAGFSSSQTRGESLNWETATTVESDNAASLAFDIVARNAGSATALDVLPTFNLFLGNDPLGTIRPEQPFPSNLRPGETSDFITIDRRQAGNSTEEITLSLEELRDIQRGTPLRIEVVGLDAGISRWRPEDSNWACPEPCRWEEFQDQIDARTLRLLVDFGYGGDPNEIPPREFAGNPFEYRIYTGSPSTRPRFTLRNVLQFIGYDVQPAGDGLLIEGREYPRGWYMTSGPEKGGSNRDSTFLDYWDAVGHPNEIIDMEMPRGVALLMASPDPETAGPVIAGDLIYPSMRQLRLSATPKGGIPVEGGEAHLFAADGSETVVPLRRAGSSSFFVTPDSLLKAIAPGPSYVVMRDVLGYERTLGPGLTPSIPIASDCGQTSPRYWLSPKWTATNGVTTLFVGNDLSKPATGFCFNTTGRADYWYPQTNDMGLSDVLGVAVLDVERRVAVGEGALLYSDNGGQSWQRAALDPADATTFHAVAFREGTDTGIAVGDGSVFMRTTDGGRTWSRATVTGPDDTFLDVDYAGDGIWYAVAGTRIRRSTDDGLTWSAASLLVFDNDGNPVERPDVGNLNAVSFISATTGLVGDGMMADGFGRVYRTDDGGETWKEAMVFTNLSDITYDGDDAWYVVGRNVIYRLGLSSGDRNRVVYSAAGSALFLAADFVSPLVGFAQTEAGPVYRTDDGGETWASPFGGYPTPSHPGANFMRDIAMYDANYGASVGTDGVIGATDSGGGVPTRTVVTAVEEEDDGRELPAEIALDQNYPNPFNPVTTIAYQIGQAGPVRLEIFDMLGRSAGVLVDEAQAAGSYRVTFDASGLASGVYLYRIQAGAVSSVKRMVLLR